MRPLHRLYDPLKFKKSQFIRPNANRADYFGPCISLDMLTRYQCVRRGGELDYSRARLGFTQLQFSKAFKALLLAYLGKPGSANKHTHFNLAPDIIGLSRFNRNCY